MASGPELQSHSEIGKEKDKAKKGETGTINER
jgi:hypothetical protein